ncbi:MAG TPA: N-methyl-L-tryptophan oxidase [Chloroflexota bacterium]|nr:N-methyl-L-tryptophan oxidase [Chloroflexota bacterium]
MTREFEYIVVGLGGLGSGAAYWLARRAGKAVLGLEQFELGHERGASEDHSRVIRYSYHAPYYVELAQHAFAAWHELEADAGETLLVNTGDLQITPPGGAVPLSDYIDSMTAHDRPFELLDAAEIMRRWPQFHLDDGVRALYSPEGGIAPASKGNAAHARLARRYGATLLEGTPVTAIRPLADGVEVATAETTYRCRRLVLTADAWTNRLLEPLDLRLPLTMTQEQVTYYASPHLEEFRPGRFPIWGWLDDPFFYGVPVYGEERGVKAAQDAGGRAVTPETRTFDPDLAMLERVSAFVQRTLPRAYGPVLYSKTCIYTMTPDRDFVIDTLPGYPQIALALGGGHAYKFAGLIGRILSDLAIDGTTSYNIGPFDYERPILQMAEPPRNFMLKR